MKQCYKGLYLIVIVSILFSLGAIPAQPAKANVSLAGQPSVLTAPKGDDIPPALAPASPTANSFTLTFLTNRDTYVRALSPNTNFSTSTELYVERVATTALLDEAQATYNETLSLIGFDISSLPSNAVIDSATLQLYSMVNLLAPQAPNAITVVPDAIMQSWNVSTVTWNTKPDRLNQGETGTVYSSGWHNITVTNIVSAWQTHTLTNHGIALRLSGTQTGLADFHSADSGTTAIPRLVVTYHTTGSPALLPAQADTYINSTPANRGTNYGSASTFRVGTVLTNEQDALLQFDLTGLPANINATSATLKIYSEINLNQPEGVFDIFADLITSTWSENTVTWNSNVQHITRSDPESPYATGWMSLNVTNIVNAWLSGAYTNNGLLLRSGGSLRDFSAIPSQKLARLEIAYVSNPPPCTPVTSVTLSGPTSGLTGTSYAFTAGPTRGATTPITFNWSATDFGPPTPGTNSQSYSWSSIGSKTVTVTAQNACGSATRSKIIAISDPPSGCTKPLTGVGIQGPDEGLQNTAYLFSALLTPSDAIDPVISWTADGQTGPFNGPSATFNWGTTGTKNVTLTVSNCGGSFEANKSVYVVPTAELADLVVTNAWYEPDNARIGYLVQNRGARSVPAGFLTQIKFGSSATYTPAFPVDIPAGGVRSAYLNQVWSCAGADAVLEVSADFTKVVLEQNESNNTWQETWACDLTPPQITGGPNINSITEHTAVLTFTTDDATNMLLTYGWNTHQPSQASNGAFTTSHTYNFSGLLPGMTYFVDLLATNQNGLAAISLRAYFRTSPDGFDPVVVNAVTLSPHPFELYEFYRLTATLQNPAGADRVEFYWDSVLIGTDWSPVDGVELIFSPHAQGWTRAQFFTSHGVRVKAYNRQNVATIKDVNLTPVTVETPVAMTVISPQNGAEIFTPGSVVPPGTSLPVEYIAFFAEWKCTKNGFSENNPAGLPGVVCDAVDRLPSEVRLEVFNNSGNSKSLNITPTANYQTANISLDGLPTGSYNLRLMVKTAGEGFHTELTPLSIVQGEPTMEITRRVTRMDNYFNIELRIQNKTAVTVELTAIEDNMVGFQNVGQGGIGGVVTLKSTTETSNQMVITNLDFTLNQALNPGEIYTLNYAVIPILFEDNQYPLDIGAGPLKIYTARHGTVRRVVQATSVIDPSSATPIPLMDAYYNAVKTADYILVTNPWRVKAVYGTGWGPEIDNVYPEMARLARLKNGVLGYMKTYSGDTLDRLLTPGNYWADALNPVFKLTNQGYVLLVGETEVIPAWYMGTDYFTTFATIPDTVPYSDLPYANTGGNTARPELVIGRFLGNNPSEWLQTLDRTLSVYKGEAPWDGTNVLSVSGRGDFVTSTFIPTVKILDHIFEDANLDSSRLHMYDYPHEDRVATFYQFTPERDVIMLFGHGNPDSWNQQTISSSNAGDIPTGNATPAVFALSCETSNYEDHADGSVAEEMVVEKSAVYIGATQITELWSGEWAIKKFAREWVSHPGASFGVALNMVKDHAFAYDTGAFDHGKMFAYSYNLFGDPKYAPMPNLGLMLDGPQLDVSSASTPAGAKAPAATWSINLPDYTVEAMDGKDVVEIPGGSWLFEDGSYLVPTVTLTQDYPAGTRVNQVSLTSRGSPTSATGLHLPQVTAVPFCEDCGAGAPLPTAPTSWVPALDQDYTWEVRENADGSSTLELTLYPVHYYGPTTDLMYFRTWEFDVETIETHIAIQKLDTAQRSFSLNGPVAVDLWLKSSGLAQDVLVNTEIRREGTDELVAALPLQQMAGLSGTANLSFSWDSAGIPAGYYSIHVQVMNSKGETLTERTTPITLGRSAAAVTQFSHSPGLFKPGVNEQLHVQIQNTGDLALDGEVVILVQPVGEATETKRVTHAVSALAPGGVLTFDETWLTGGETHEAFTVTVFVRYASQVSEPVVHRIDTGLKVFLPLTKK